MGDSIRGCYELDIRFLLVEQTATSRTAAA